MSDIPQARRILQNLVEQGGLPTQVNETIITAMLLMRRPPPVRRSHATRTVITEDMRHKIWALSKDKNLSMSHIATLVGLPSSASGRVSEVLNYVR
jgi:hypothetical protein